VKLPLARIAELVSGSGKFDHNAIARGYSIDSRTIQPGELFFAVRGERLDGHDFVEAALKQGAPAAVVGRAQQGRFAGVSNLLVVEETLTALQSLATAVRRLWGKTVVGVTGSTGKTTTKEAIAHVLSARYRVLKSEGNHNNHFGLPLQLLRLEAEQEIAVMEMGMSRAGEIAALAAIAHPEIGVVTNVAPVHLEFFKSVEEIARAKYELVAALPRGGVAVLNADDEYVSQFGRDFYGKVITYGIARPAEVRAENVRDRGREGSTFDLVTDGGRWPASIPLLGRHNIYNVLAAVAVALDRGIAPGEAIAKAATLGPPDQRGKLLSIAGATVINDCYNSNPKALEAMVDSLATLPAKRRIVVAGEMLELGASGPDLHAACGAYMARRKIDFLLGVRGLAEFMVASALKEGAQAEFVETPEQAAEWLAREIRPGDAVLLKASRGVRLERALELWMKSSGSTSGAQQHG
jgi:UDP-N-acetylmuramoyl-tripeptide--D-alanyl-D-alanine ligase